MHKPVFMFAGPTLYGVEIDTQRTSEICWLAPARRGDVSELVRRCDEPGAIGLADGTFHSFPSIGHLELRRAIDAGWKIYGLCSMGAIRAAEMQHMGLTPYGKVAAMFCEDPEFSDDEVTLVHGDDPPFVPLSEPLVHIREFVKALTDSDLLTKVAAGSILNELKHRWYGDRTLELLREMLKSKFTGKELSHGIVSAMIRFSDYRIKQADLLSFVIEKPWRRDERGTYGSFKFDVADLHQQREVK